MDEAETSGLFQNFSTELFSCITNNVMSIKAENESRVCLEIVTKPIAHAIKLFLKSVFYRGEEKRLECSRGQAKLTPQKKM